MQGTVKNFGKSYGFICGENDKEYFVHYSNLKAGYKRLHSGDYVEFTHEENDKGLIATNVMPVLTLKMVKDKAKKENLYLKPRKDMFGVTVWLVVDQNDIIQAGEQGMSLRELNEYFS